MAACPLLRTANAQPSHAKALTGSHTTTLGSVQKRKNRYAHLRKKPAALFADKLHRCFSSGFHKSDLSFGVKFVDDFPRAFMIALPKLKPEVVADWKQSIKLYVVSDRPWKQSQNAK